MLKKTMYIGHAIRQINLCSELLPYLAKYCKTLKNTFQNIQRYAARK